MKRSHALQQGSHSTLLEEKWKGAERVAETSPWGQE